jgi:hypothetical protein
MGPNEPYREDEVERPRIYFSTEPRFRNDPNFQKEFQQVLINTACHLAESRAVYMMRPIPEMALHVPNTVTRNILFGRGNQDFTIDIEDYNVRHKTVIEAQDMAAEQCGIRILDPVPYLCDESKCFGSKNGRPLYIDGNHLSEYGNRFLNPMFESIEF